MSKRRPKKRSKPPALPPLPVLPARPVDPVAQPAPPPPAIAALQAPTGDDPLAAQLFIHRGLVASFADAAIDPNLSPRERRRELRAIAHAAVRLVPQSRIYLAEERVLADRRELEKKARHRQGAKLEPLTAAGRLAALRMEQERTAKTIAELEADLAGKKES